MSITIEINIKHDSRDVVKRNQGSIPIDEVYLMNKKMRDIRDARNKELAKNKVKEPKTYLRFTKKFAKIPTAMTTGDKIFLRSYMEVMECVEGSEKGHVVYREDGRKYRFQSIERTVASCKINYNLHKRVKDIYGSAR